MPAGRPSLYTDEMADKICTAIAEGHSVNRLCKLDEYPAQRTIYMWLIENAEFMQKYTRAREIQADTLFHECLDIADSQEGDVFLKEDGTEITNHDAIARAKLRVDTRKWMAGKLRPKVYGEKVLNEVSGANGGPVDIILNLGFVSPKETNGD